MFLLLKDEGATVSRSQFWKESEEPFSPSEMGNDNRKWRYSVYHVRYPLRQHGSCLAHLPHQLKEILAAYRLKRLKGARRASYLSVV